ncbi:hypothetical protein RS3R2_36460 [Pseudomonas lactis]|nr:hypothetical protein RS3R2_36460 [Pseudomonas lactis]
MHRWIANCNARRRTLRVTRSVTGGIPTQSVGTISDRGVGNVGEQQRNAIQAKLPNICPLDKK